MIVKGIILAGGKGLRFSSKQKKQFYCLNKIPLIIRSTMLLEQSNQIDEIVIVCCEEDIDRVKVLVSKYNLKKVKKIVMGGSNSIESSRNGLDAIDHIGGCDKIVFHESVRPFVTKKELDSLIEIGKKNNCACLASECYESILIKDNELYGTNQINRDILVRVQMPQMYDFDVAKNILNQMIKTNNILPSINLGATFYGYKMCFSICSKWNIKITTQEDFAYAKKISKLAQ